MKVLLLATHLNVGGIGVYTASLARYLKTEGVSVTVASSGGDLEKALQLEGIRHIKLDIKTKSEFGLKVWKALPLLVKLIRDEGFQLVHAQTRVAQVLAYLAGRRSRVPFVATCHGFFQYRKFARRILPCWGERTIAISESVRKHLVEDFRLREERVTLVYNGIELAKHSSGAQAKDQDLMKSIGIKEGAMIIGTIGRLSPVKGYKFLVSAFKDVFLNKDECQLLFVGEGPDEKHLKQQVEDLGIGGKVLFTPGGEPLDKYLALMDIFVLPSVHEGLGLALMEAMASGRACIATSVGGLTELITHEKDGLLIPPKSPEALSRAILRLAEDSPLRERLAQAAREKAMKNFSIEKSVKKTIEVYKEVLGAEA